jgi:hypothetical protein
LRSQYFRPEAVVVPLPVVLAGPAAGVAARAEAGQSDTTAREIERKNAQSAKTAGGRARDMEDLR